MRAHVPRILSDEPRARLTFTIVSERDTGDRQWSTSGVTRERVNVTVVVAIVRFSDRRVGSLTRSSAKVEFTFAGGVGERSAHGALIPLCQ